MITENTIRKHIRKVLEEEINNFLNKEEATFTKKLNDTSTSQELGDPLFDVEMNQMGDDQGSDEVMLPQ